MFILAQFQPSQLQGAWPFALGLGKKQYVMAEESCHGGGELLISQQLAAERQGRTWGPDTPQ